MSDKKENIKISQLLAQVWPAIVDLILTYYRFFGKMFEYWRLGVLFLPKDKPINLTLKADFSNLKKIRDFIGLYGKRAGLSRKQISNMQLVMDEQATNIIRHAYQDMEKGNISVDFIVKSNKIVLISRDTGVEFNWNKVLDPDLDRYVDVKRKGGLGIMLIRKLTDEAYYEREGNTNKVVTEFNFKEEKKQLLIKDLIKDIRGRFTMLVRFTATALVFVGVLVVAIYFVFENFNKDDAKRALLLKGKDLVESMAELISLNVAANDYILLNEIVNERAANMDGVDYIQILNEDGTIIAHTDPDRLFDDYIRPSGLEPLGTNKIKMQGYLDGNNEVFYDVGAPIQAQGGSLSIHVSFSRNTLDIAELSRVRRSRIAFVLIGLYIFASVGFVILIYNFQRPIKAFIGAMNRIGTEGFDPAKLEGSGSSEFREIERAMIDMAQRLKDQEGKLTDQTRLNREVQLAKEIQDAILPDSTPEIDGFKVVGRYQSAVEMGGDYYDFVDVGDELFGLAVGDVSGKGIGSAFIMAITRMALRSEARGIRRASDVLNKVNAIVAPDIKKGMYITIFYTVLDSKKRTINYASAGHNPMIIYRAKEKSHYMLNPRGVAVGLDIPQEKFKEFLTSQSVTLAKDDLVFIYTDGITEAMDHDRDEYGEPRLIDFIKKNHHLSVEEFATELDKDILEFTQGAPQADDITYIVVKGTETKAEIRYNKVKELYDRLENQNQALEDVLKELSLTFDEYQDEILPLYKLGGLKAFEPKIPDVADEKMEYMSLEQSKKMVEIIRKNPDYGVKRILDTLHGEPYLQTEVTGNQIKKELKRLKLERLEQRKRFSKRKLSSFSAITDIRPD